MPNLAEYIGLRLASLSTGIPRRTLLQHIHDGRLPATKLDGYTSPWMIRRRDLTRYTAQRNKQKDKATA